MDTESGGSTPEKLAGGGLAGLAATGAMSALLVAADATGVMNYEPPRKIIDKFFPRLPLPLRDGAAVLAHFGYGVAGGCLYVLTRRKQSTPGAGLAYGALVWVAGYEGWLPAMGILPPAHRDKTGRAVTMLAAHLLYGAVLGKVLEGPKQGRFDRAPAVPGDPSRSSKDEDTTDRPSQLPESYARYLAGKDPGFTATVLPVLEQSAAAQEHGVHVRFIPGGVQALVDPAVPYPQVSEGVD
ncbi:DUF6789 family protein [Pseudarthrobacter niigatensis]|uniref:DUF1440 domain-containing protein n=1 Tax=Pseudarthrobacter niigatensis TaxID=369935 RepID=A0AAJ1T002_9MICC|nr:DUF6789 family protein [Pseudarthrobacter niigatensis]MDQ0147756.1 hypothetical protein [Pseudarthrobacter niigatensis]MDQ0267762.1 hypothetical protein [Pseudarthrobacter niigatensis]